MKDEFILDLSVTRNRPVIILAGAKALLDTGSEIPICFLKHEQLVDAYDAEFVLKKTYITGFGGKAYGDVYKIKCLEVGKLIFPDMHVFVPYEFMTEYRFLFSATMFNGLIYEINTQLHTMRVQVPDSESIVRHLRIFDKDGNLHVLCTSIKE